MSEPTLLQVRIADAIGKHGSLRAAAAVLKVDYTYLYRLGKGEVNNPGNDLLRKLKLRRVITYVDNTKGKRNGNQSNASVGNSV